MTCICERLVIAHVRGYQRQMQSLLSALPPTTASTVIVNIILQSTPNAEFVSCVSTDHGKTASIIN
jgi:hypothetical protein